MLRSAPVALVALLAAAALLPTSVTGFAPVGVTVGTRHHLGASKSSPKPAQTTAHVSPRDYQYTRVANDVSTKRRLSTVWEKRWWARFDELQAYKALHGDCNVPQGWERNPPLANWVNNQRTQYQYLMSDDPKKKSSMKEERIMALEGIGFEWVLVPHTEWELRFDELSQYKKEHGNCDVPQSWSENPQLGKWVNQQRAQYKLHQEGKPSWITEERITALEDVGFEWVLVTRTEWETRFDELLQYRKEHGDCNVPVTWSENPQLGKWVSQQRAQYKLHQEGKPSWITEERIAALEDIGFEWVLVTLTEWETRFDELLQYKKEYENCNVPQTWSENPQLGRWVSDQRTQYRYRQEGKPSSITKERISALQSVGFEWVLVTRTEWETRFDELLQYEKEHGNCNVPQTWSENPQLGSWVNMQRQHYKYRQEGKGSNMTRERVKQLESIGFQWKLRKGRKK